MNNTRPIKVAPTPHPRKARVTCCGTVLFRPRISLFTDASVDAVQARGREHDAVVVTSASKKWTPMNKNKTSSKPKPKRQYRLTTGVRPRLEAPPPVTVTVHPQQLARSGPPARARRSSSPSQLGSPPPPSNRAGAEEDADQVQTEFLTEAHPWPVVSTYFALKEITRGKVEKYSFICLSCRPQYKIIKADSTSRSNLRKHMINKHSECLAAYDLTAAGGKEKCVVKPTDPFQAAKVVALQQLQSKSKLKPAPQVECNRLLARAVVDALCCFTLVDQPSFREYLHAMQPNRTVPSRRTLMRLIGVAYTKLKGCLKNHLADVKYVATTTDCWSASHRYVYV